MTWVAMTIPENPADLPGWLELQMVGPDLGRLVLELRAVHENRPPPRALEALLGEQISMVLDSGLSVLPRETLGELLRYPDLLLELQERVLVEGGDYWSSLPVPAAFGPVLDRGWERLQAAIGPKILPAPAESERQSPGFFRRTLPYVLTSFATAAAVLLVVYFGRPAPTRAPEVETAWGWQRPDAFPADLDRTAYLKRLADEAEEWFQKRPTTAAETAKRLGEFRQGCSDLLRADHRSLPEADRTWLKERCRLWAKKLDEQLTRLDETGAVDDTLQATDAMVRQITQRIRERIA